MNSRKYILFWVILFMLPACSTHKSSPQNFSSIPSLDEQCKILNKKREPVKIKKSKRGSRPIKNDHHAIVEFQHQNIYPDFSDFEAPDNESLQSYLFLSPTITEIQAFNSPHSILILDQQEAPMAPAVPVIVEPEHIPNSPAFDTVIETENVIQTGIESNFIPLLAGASGILSIMLLGAFQKQSKRISRWAVRNPWKTRGMLTVLHLSASAGAIAIGHHLSLDGLIISNTVKYAAASAIGVVVCLYPFSSTANYLYRKTQDVALFTSGAVMMLYAGNHFEITQQPQTQRQVIYSFASNTHSNGWNVVKKEISIPKYQKQEEPKKKKSAEKGALTFLAVLAFIALGYGIAALSCSLSCSGHEVMAGIVGIGGLLALVIGFIAVLREIFGKSRRKKKQKSELQTTQA